MPTGTASFLGSVWLGLVVVAHLAFGRREELRPLLLSTVVMGWVAILSVTLVMQFSHRPSPLQEAAQSLTAFEYASNAAKVPPRALEPLIGE